MESVARACDAFLKQHLLQPTNCISLRTFAEQHGRQDLVRHADNFIAENFQAAVLHEEFLSAITESNLAALLRNDLLNVESETVVYEAVLRCAPPRGPRLPLFTYTTHRSHALSCNAIRQCNAMPTDKTGVNSR